MAEIDLNIDLDPTKTPDIASPSNAGNDQPVNV